MLHLTRALAIVLTLASVAAAQSPGHDWNNVKALAAGAEVRVNVKSRIVRGEIQNVTDDSLTVSSGKGHEMLARQEVLHVSVKTKSHRGRNTLIGLGGGAALGLVVAVAGGCADFGGSTTSGAAYAACTISLGAIGTLVGVLIPTGRWREVYKRP